MSTNLDACAEIEFVRVVLAFALAEQFHEVPFCAAEANSTGVFTFIHRKIHFLPNYFSDLLKTKIKHRKWWK